MMFTRRLRRLAAPLALAGLSAACGPTPEPTTPGTATISTINTSPKSAQAMSSDTSASTASAQASAPEFNPVAVGMTQAGVQKLCDDHLKKADELLAQIKALKGAPADKLTYEATLGRFDQMVLELNNAGEFPYLMAVAHPDQGVREAAKTCEPKTEKFTTAMWLDADLAGVIKAYAQKGEKLTGERARLLHDVLRDFRRNGLDLPPEKQQRLREINESITTNGQMFISNIGASKETLLVDAKALEGLPPEYVANHPPNADGKVELSTDYPDFFPFVTYSRDRKAAKALYVLFTNRGGDKNVKILEVILKLRHEKAKLLGYASWADYATEPRMAKSAKNVAAFLDTIRDALKEPAKAELAEFMAEHVRLGGNKMDKLAPSDRYFLEDRVRNAKYKFNSQELSNYFDISAVKAGLMSITARMYGIEYKEVPAQAWHPDVTAYEVWSGGKLIGKFYFDLFSRPDKYKHAAMFGVRSAKRLPDGTYQTPIAALECNFPKPGAQAALMSHDEVVTFFHEFGHVLHHILTRSELASFSGTATVRDFVEAPSQMFEEWAWSREVLDLFAKHHKTGEKIPDDLFAAMQKARTFGRALSTQRQLFLAKLDQEFHTRAPGANTTNIVKEVQNSTDPSFPYVAGTHFQSSFGHLIGYDAGYYGYQWALALSRDVLTRFKKEGLLNPKTAADWRNEVLAKGGGEDETEMLTRFLGRAPNHEAYIAYLKGKDN